MEKKREKEGKMLLKMYFVFSESRKRKRRQGLQLGECEKHVVAT